MDTLEFLEFIEIIDAMGPEQLDLLARLGCGGDNTRWSFSDAGLKRLLIAFVHVATFNQQNSKPASPSEIKLLTHEEAASIFHAHLGHAWGYTKPQRDYAVALQQAFAKKNNYKAIDG